jgi:hypothetical protein
MRGGRAAILAELWHPPKARGYFDGDVRDLFPPTPRQYILSEDVVLAESLRGQIAPSSLPPNKALRRINV